MTLAFSVPGVPPSVNRLLAAARTVTPKDGRPSFVQHYTPAKHRDWCREVWAAFKAHYPGHRPLAGRAKVQIELRFPTKRATDIDNYAKAALDALVQAKVLEDDSQIDELRLLRVPSAGKALAMTRYEISEVTP